MKKFVSRLYNQIFKEVTPVNNTLALISRKDLNIFEALQAKRVRDFKLNKPAENILLSGDNNISTENMTVKDSVSCISCQTSSTSITNNLSQSKCSKLHSAKITEEHEDIFHQTQNEIVNMFPEKLEDGFPIKENVIKALEYLDTK